jgi:hypothetical protein
MLNGCSHLEGSTTFRCKNPITLHVHGHTCHTFLLRRFNSSKQKTELRKIIQEQEYGENFLERGKDILLGRGVRIILLEGSQALLPRPSEDFRLVRGISLRKSGILNLL